MNYYEEALRLTIAERYNEAIPYIKEALKWLPKGAELHASLAMCYLGIGDDKKAEKSIKKSLKLNPDNAISFLIIANIYKKQGKIDKSEIYIEKALKRNPNNAAVLAFYANLLTEKGEQAKAIEYAKKAEKIDPSKALECATLMATIGKTDKRSRHFRILRESLSEDLPDKHLIPSAFALASCYDKTGDYDNAFKYYEIANNHKLSLNMQNNTAHDPERHRAFCQSIKQLLPADKVKEYTGKGNQSKEPIFILGMPRSGTTLTESIISAKEVNPSGELPHFSNIGNYFDYPEGEEWSNCDFAKVGKKYLDRTKLRGSRFTDKLPNNFHFVGLIRLCFPNAKIIHVKRNPYDTCLSNYFANFSQLRYTNDLRHLAAYYNDYLDLMEHWRKCVDFYEFDYESLIDNQESETRKLIDYCELEWSNDYLSPHKNKRKVITASVTQVRQPVYKTSKNKHENYSQYLDILYKGIN